MTRSCMMLLVAVLWAWVSGCAPQRYAYRFEVENPVNTGEEVTAKLDVDPVGARDIALALTNHSPEPVQVAWTQISLLGPAGQPFAMRPEEDLGWVPVGGTVTARLSPFTLPDEGEAARMNEGARFQLEVPMTVRRQTVTYRFTLAAHLSPLASNGTAR